MIALAYLRVENVGAMHGAVVLVDATKNRRLDRRMFDRTSGESFNAAKARVRQTAARRGYVVTDDAAWFEGRVR